MQRNCSLTTYSEIRALMEQQLENQRARAAAEQSAVSAPPGPQFQMGTCPRQLPGHRVPYAGMGSFDSSVPRAARCFSTGSISEDRSASLLAAVQEPVVPHIADVDGAVEGDNGCSGRPPGGGSVRSARRTQSGQRSRRMSVQTAARPPVAIAPKPPGTPASGPLRPRLAGVQRSFPAASYGNAGYPSPAVPAARRAQSFSFDSGARDAPPCASSPWSARSRTPNPGQSERWFTAGVQGSSPPQPETTKFCCPPDSADVTTSPSDGTDGCSGAFWLALPAGSSATAPVPNYPYGSPGHLGSAIGKSLAATPGYRERYMLGLLGEAGPYATAQPALHVTAYSCIGGSPGMIAGGKQRVLARQRQSSLASCNPGNSVHPNGPSRSTSPYNSLPAVFDDANAAARPPTGVFYPVFAHRRTADASGAPQTSTDDPPDSDARSLRCGETAPPKHAADNAAGSRAARKEAFGDPFALALVTCAMPRETGPFSAFLAADAGDADVLGSLGAVPDEIASGVTFAPPDPKLEAATLAWMRQGSAGVYDGSGPETCFYSRRCPQPAAQPFLSSILKSDRHIHV